MDEPRRLERVAEISCCGDVIDQRRRMQRPGSDLNVIDSLRGRPKRGDRVRADLIMLEVLSLDLSYGKPAVNSRDVALPIHMRAVPCATPIAVPGKGRRSVTH